VSNAYIAVLATTGHQGFVLLQVSEVFPRSGGNFGSWPARGCLPQGFSSWLTSDGSAESYSGYSGSSNRLEELSLLWLVPGHPAIPGSG